jgi:hypothetical protein
MPRPGARQRVARAMQRCLAAQHDAVIHLDVTHALEPLERRAPTGGEVAETVPTGMRRAPGCNGALLAVIPS